MVFFSSSIEWSRERGPQALLQKSSGSLREKETCSVAANFSLGVVSHAMLQLHLPFTV